MGASNSKIEDDKALQLCKERKKYVKQALDGRCSLAATHVAYIQSIKTTGTALKKFVEPDVPVESSLYTSTNATPEILHMTEKSLSRFSFSSPSRSQHVDTTYTLSPSPSPPPDRFHVNHMKYMGGFSKKVEEKLSFPVTGTILTSSTAPYPARMSTERLEASATGTPEHQPETPPWDYFGLFHPVDHQFSDQEGREMNEGVENINKLYQLRREEGITQLEEEAHHISSPGTQDSEESEDEFDEPPVETLVRSFENRNRATDKVGESVSPTFPSSRSADSEADMLNGEKSSSPGLTPLTAASSSAAHPSIEQKIPEKEEHTTQNKVMPKDFFSSMKDIEALFTKASAAGKEVPKMLETDKLHFRPIFPGKEGNSMASTFLKACFSCGEDPNHVPDEPVQSDIKYLTWHRTASSLSSSSRNPLDPGIRDNGYGLPSDLYDDYSMTSGSHAHASTLDRLYAWERKLYDEVKASEMVRRDYDIKCKLLRQQESNAEASQKIDKTRAVVKDLHSRIRVAIHRIDTISKKIEELRDTELQPQLEELISEFSRMWDVMLECHASQCRIISIAHSSGNSRISTNTDARRQITIHLENELLFMSSSFTKWINAQKSYLQAIDSWLLKCVSFPQKSSRRKRRRDPPSIRKFGPPIYVICGEWLEKLDKLPMKELADSMKGLAVETSSFLPRQEKSQGKPGSNMDPGISIMRDEVNEDINLGLERFRTNLVNFLSELKRFAESSVHMYRELQKAIEESKHNYDLYLKSRS